MIKLLKLMIITILCNVSCQINCSYEERVLEELAIKYIDKYRPEFSEIQSYMQRDHSIKIPIIIFVTQEEDYIGNKHFTIFYIEGLSQKRPMPTKLIKRNGHYIAMFLDNRKPIFKEKIPNKLFRDRDYFTHEGCWIVLMCKNSKRYIAIDDRWATPYEMITQLQEFSCDDEHSKKRPWGRIEDAIIDPNVIVIPPPEPKYLKSVIDSL